MQVSTEPQPSPLLQKRERLSLYWKERGGKGVEGGKKQWSHVSLVWRCWVLDFRVMWCCAVMFPEEGLDLLTACLQTVGRKTFAAVVPPLSTQFISSHTLIHFLLLGGGKQLSTFRIDSWFYQAETPHWVGWVGRSLGWRFPSFLFHFGIVRLAPTGRPWGCHRAHFSWEAGPLLAANCQTCITWKVLHRF